MSGGERPEPVQKYTLHQKFQYGSERCWRGEIKTVFGIEERFTENKI